MINLSLSLLIIPVSFIAIWLLVNTYLNRCDWRLSFLLAFVTINIYIVFLTELLSSFTLLTKAMVFISWLVPILFLIALKLIINPRKQILFPRFSFTSWNWYDWIILFFVILIMLILGITALIAPPNTPDVLNYHMPRVMHWIQNHSVRHYPSGIEIQNSYPPAAEFQVLQLVILNGNDRWSNFAAWFTLLATAICASYLTSFLEVPRSGQLLSSLFVVTLPISISQASSVKNDLQVAFWILLVLTLMLEYYSRPNSRNLLIFIFAAIGLGLLTKTNTIVYLAPILMWFAIKFIKNNGLKSVLQWGLVALLVISIINAGYLIRNVQTYNALMEPHQSSRLMNDSITPGGVFSNMLRNATFHAQFPWPTVRNNINLFILKVHVKLGMDINEPRVTSDGYFSVMELNTNETLSGNTFHAWLLIFLLVIYVINFRKKKRNALFYWLLFFAGSGYVLFSALLKWQAFGARYFLPVFFLMAPIFGLVLSSIKYRVFTLPIILAMVVFSWPWLLVNEFRPLISSSMFTNDPSILKADRMSLLLGGDQQIYPGLYALPEIVKQTQCNSIGIYGGGDTKEYHIWAILDSPRDDLRLEWIVAGTPSAAYIDPDFDPCLIVCHQCRDDQTHIKNLTPLFKGNTYIVYGENNAIEE